MSSGVIIPNRDSNSNVLLQAHFISLTITDHNLFGKLKQLRQESCNGGNKSNRSNKNRKEESLPNAPEVINSLMSEI